MTPRSSPGRRGRCGPRAESPCWPTAPWRSAGAASTPCWRPAAPASMTPAPIQKPWPGWRHGRRPAAASPRSAPAPSSSPLPGCSTAGGRSPTGPGVPGWPNSIRRWPSSPTPSPSGTATSTAPPGSPPASTWRWRWSRRIAAARWRWPSPAIWCCRCAAAAGRASTAPTLPVPARAPRRSRRCRTGSSPISARRSASRPWPSAPPSVRATSPGCSPPTSECRRAASSNAPEFDEARRLLCDTAEPVEVVAGRAGFPTAERMRRAFARHLGVTPRAWRARFRPEE